MYTVRITMEHPDSGEWVQFLWDAEDAPIGQNKALPCELKENARAWAMTAVEQVKTLITAEPITAPIPREAIYKRWEDAIDAFGEEETFDVVDKLISSRDGLPLRTRVARLERHPAFQLLHRGGEHDPRGQWLINEFMRGRYQDLPESDVRALEINDQLTYLMRRLLSTLAVRHQGQFAEGELTPLGRQAQRGSWMAVIHKLRQVYHPTGERVTKTRMQNESRKASKQEQDRQIRSSMKQPKGQKPAMVSKK